MDINNISKTTGERLVSLRNKFGMSQAQVANTIGVDRTSYAKYEKNVNKPTRKLKELSSLFNVTSDYIMCLSNDPHGTMVSNGKGFFEQHLLDKNSPSSAFPTQYYDDPVVAQMANDLKENPDMRILFDASRRLSPRDLAAVINIVKSINGDED